MKLAYWACFVFLSVLFFVGSVSAIPLRVHVQVNNGVSLAPVSGAGVVITDLSATPPQQTSTSTNVSGRTPSSSPANIQDNHNIRIVVNAQGYLTNTSEFNVGPFSDFPDKLFTIYLTPSAVAPTGPLFVVNEKIANTAEGGCGTGWNKTITFTDAYSGTYEHCVQYGPFSSGGTYVVDSYIKNASAYDDTTICGGNVRSGAPFRTTDNQFAVLCVNQSSVLGYTDGITRIMSNATAVLNTVCPIPLLERGNASVQNGLLRHCTYVYNTPSEPPPVSGCGFTSVQWIYENATIITANIPGWLEDGNHANGVLVYPFVTMTDACSGKAIHFDIFEESYEPGETPSIQLTETSNAFYSQGDFANKRAAYPNVPWKPVWRQRPGPQTTSGPIDYWFIARVNGESVVSSLSPRLTVLKPLEKCTSDDNCTAPLPFCDTQTGSCIAIECDADADCADGEICSATGGCVSETSACTFSNIEWHKAGSQNPFSGTLRAGGIDGKKCGEVIYLKAIGGTPACNSLRNDIKFKIKENDWAFDDGAFSLNSFLLSGSFESDYWKVILPSQGVNSFSAYLDRLELWVGSLQYYPVPVVEGSGGEEVEIAVSNPPPTLRVMIEDVDCREDRDCAEGSGCDTECGVCVEGLGAECRLNSDCEVDETCNDDGECVGCESDEECTGNEICNEENECSLECEADGDCSSGRACVENKCVACIINSDCGEEEVCEEGECSVSTGSVCVIASRDCNADAGERCVGGVCVAPCALSNPLWVDESGNEISSPFEVTPVRESSGVYGLDSKIFLQLDAENCADERVVTFDFEKEGGVSSEAYDYTKHGMVQNNAVSLEVTEDFTWSDNYYRDINLTGEAYPELSDAEHVRLGNLTVHPIGGSGGAGGKCCLPGASYDDCWLSIKSCSSNSDCLMGNCQHPN